MHVETVARLIELKPGSAERVRDWAAFINEHRQAAASESPIDAYTSSSRSIRGFGAPVRWASCSWI
ncbi:MAG: hypothetical protein P8Y69_11845 [Gammaproteobacteria bacterium]